MAFFRVLDTGKGWAYRLRIPSYDRELLDDVRRLLDVGSISRERKPAGPYYRLELADRAQVSETLRSCCPTSGRKGSW